MNAFLKLTVSKNRVVLPAQCDSFVLATSRLEAQGERAWLHGGGAQLWILFKRGSLDEMCQFSCLSFDLKSSEEARWTLKDDRIFSDNAIKGATIVDSNTEGMARPGLHICWSVKMRRDWRGKCISVLVGGRLLSDRCSASNHNVSTEYIRWNRRSDAIRL